MSREGSDKKTCWLVCFQAVTLKGACRNTEREGALWDLQGFI